MYPELLLRDNGFYNVFYSLHIYNKSEDISETAIDEFIFDDTKVNDNKYHVIKTFNFKKGLIQLMTSDKIKSVKQIKAAIGPKYDNLSRILAI